MAKSKITEPKSYERFTPYKINKMTESEIRREYSKLRSVANKRLTRMQKLNIGMKAREGFRFPTIKEIESSIYSVGSMLADVSKWVADYRSSVTGEKQFLTDFQEMFTEKGYGDLVETPEQIYSTIKFLESIREDYNDQLLPSGDALDALQQAERLKIPHYKLLENIDLFVEHLDDLENVQPTKGGRTFSSRRLNALIRKWEK